MTNIRELFLSLVDGVTRGFIAAAVTSPLTDELIKACNISWALVHTDRESMVRAATMAGSLFGLDTVRVPFDQCVEAEALGVELNFDGRYPKPRSFVEVLEHTEFLGRGRTRMVIEAVRVLRNGLGQDVPLLGGVTGPFTVLTYLFGPAKLLSMCRRQQGAVRATAEKLSVAIANYARELISAGADAIVIEDMASSPDVLNPSLFRSVEVEPLRLLTSSLDAPCILHICGDTFKILEDIPKTGARVFHIDPKTNLEDARVRAVGISLAGGVDTTLLLRGTGEEISKASVACARSGIRIVAPACALHPKTPSKNVRAMTEMVKRLNQLI